MAFATRTWDGWDYVPHAWPVWLEATDGVLLVASAGPGPGGEPPLDAVGQPLGGQPIAISRVALLAPTEGWVEGIRVDPRARGMGVATDLQTAELHWLAAHDTAITRYATGARNEGSHRLGARHGFELMTRYRTWFWRDSNAKLEEHDEEELNGFDEPTRQAASRRRQELLARLDADGLTLRPSAGAEWWQRVKGDAAFAATGRLYERRSWAQQELNEAAFAAHVEAHEVVVLDQGTNWSLAIISADARPAEDVSVHMALTVGNPAAVLNLAKQIQRVAGETIRFRLPVDHSPAIDDPVFAAASFEARPFELHILSRPGSAPLPAVEPHRLVLAEEPRRVIRPPT